MQISKKQKRYKRAKNPGTMWGIAHSALLEFDLRGSLTGFLAWFLKEKILNITTSWVSLMIIPCSSTSIQQLRNIYNKKCNNKNILLPSEVRVFETKAGPGERTLCSISPQFWHSSKTMQNLYTKVYRTSWEEDPVLPCIEDPPM